MIKVASCEQALIKTNKKPIENHQNNTMFLFKRTHLNFSVRHLEHMVNYQGMHCGLPVFVIGEFDAFEIFMQNEYFAKSQF